MRALLFVIMPFFFINFATESILLTIYRFRVITNDITSNESKNIIRIGHSSGICAGN